MSTATPDFVRWLAQASVPAANLTDSQCCVLQAAFAFLQRCGRDYYSVRLLSHFLLHCQLGLAVAQIARLLQLSRSAASLQQNRSSKEVVQAAHHRLSGRPHGKLLPRFAGPIAHFLHQHQDATRWDLLDFIRDHCGVSVSRMALHKFLIKYGLDGSGPVLTLPKPSATTSTEPAASPAAPLATGPEAMAVADDPVPAQPSAPPPAGVPLPLPPSAFFCADPLCRRLPDVARRSGLARLR
jgi:hypothetical protein